MHRLPPFVVGTIGPARDALKDPVASAWPDSHAFLPSPASVVDSTTGRGEGRDDPAYDADPVADPE
jgi:hypothetical protein